MNGNGEQIMSVDPGGDKVARFAIRGFRQSGEAFWWIGQSVKEVAERVCEMFFTGDLAFTLLL